MLVRPAPTDSGISISRNGGFAFGPALAASQKWLPWPSTAHALPWYSASVATVRSPEMTLVTTPELLVTLMVLTPPAASPIASRLGAMTLRPSGCFSAPGTEISVIVPAAPVPGVIGIRNSLPDCASVP